MLTIVLRATGKILGIVYPAEYMENRWDYIAYDKGIEYWGCNREMYDEGDCVITYLKRCLVMEVDFVFSD